jgi:hypothetical protein
MTIKGVVVADYGKVQEILISVVAMFVIFIMVIGPECVFPPPEATMLTDHPPTGTTAHTSRSTTQRSTRVEARTTCGSTTTVCTRRWGRAAHNWNVEAAENEKASEERLSTEKPAVTPAWMVLT